MELQVVASVDGDNPVENDLQLVNGSVVFVEGLALEVAQRLRIRLRFFKGEWFLDQRIGTPYYQNILIKNPPIHTVKAIFTNVIVKTQGVRELLSLTYNFNRITREFFLDFTARLEDDTTFRASEYGPFIVEI